MRRRIMSVISVSAMLAVVGASAAGASGGAGTVSHNRPAKVGAFAPNLTILYNQTANDSGVGIVSQDFTDAGYDVYDSNGADDFVVPAGHVWTIKGMRFIGVYFGCVTCGPADTETITIYKNAGGVPGAPLGSGTVTAVDNAGTFTATLPNIHLQAGTYWVSVQATMNFAAGGEWAWETTNTLTGNAAVWKNPGDGFLTGCTTYQNMQGCIGPSGEGPDFMFAIAGTTT
jgi:hypothetical protein